MVAVVGITATRPGVMSILPPRRSVLAPVFLTTSVDRLPEPEIAVAVVPTVAVTVVATDGDEATWSDRLPTVMDEEVVS
jgi:hypothetical protein